ncbi:hypothetical protein H4R20_005156 [Coemansia guatemalensis]|uniref:Uncharacterized protein n=1 Tax=Coemansia guatemalensis TaxID=2761395 RepID=A0A9W8HQC6_9FUNG|nr:hypothetical protein H4R20_005156 [Coemansia guatemalensis]
MQTPNSTQNTARAIHSPPQNTLNRAIIRKAKALKAKLAAEKATANTAAQTAIKPALMHIPISICNPLNMLSSHQPDQTASPSTDTAANKPCAKPRGKDVNKSIRAPVGKPKPTRIPVCGSSTLLTANSLDMLAPKSVKKLAEQDTPVLSAKPVKKVATQLFNLDINKCPPESTNKSAEYTACAMASMSIDNIIDKADGEPVCILAGPIANKATLQLVC